MFDFLRKLAWHLFGRCPVCGDELDSNVHGFDQKWLHCHSCGYCTYAKYAGQATCGVHRNE